MIDFAVGYLDPGSGSLLIQVIIASVLAVPYFLRTRIGRALDSLRGRNRQSRPSAGGDSETPSDVD
jgi:hypothetical protein